jgi:hypothetical protein
MGVIAPTPVTTTRLCSMETLNMSFHAGQCLLCNEGNKELPDHGIIDPSSDQRDARIKIMSDPYKNVVL